MIYMGLKKKKKKNLPLLKKKEVSDDTPMKNPHKLPLTEIESAVPLSIIYESDGFIVMITIL